MNNAFIFLFRIATDLYVLTFILRLILQGVGADAHNPLSQFILRVTNPVVIRVRRYIPTIKGWDAATITIILFLELLASIVLLNVICIGMPGIGESIGLAILRSAYLLLNTYFFLILAYVIISWVGSGGYNPLVAVLVRVVEPVLRPFRKYIPAIGGIDLSPLFAAIAIQFGMQLLPFGYVLKGMVCLSPASLI
ncbi:MAG: YggT family protein [Gammaproteobacteria bacterium]